jgi:hypothetical protein
MKQSRGMSLLEAAVSTAVGFGLSVLFQELFFARWLGMPLPLEINLTFAALMTAVSIGRQFVLRRLFELLHIRVPLSPAMLAVVAERRRQVEAEGWTAEHDDAHRQGDMAQAGGCYAIAAAAKAQDGAGVSARWMTAEIGRIWPWAGAWWKPRDFRRDLVRAGALIIAEIERFDRMKKRKRS